MARLTEKNKRFARAVASGKALTDSYKEAGYSAKQTKHCLRENAYKLSKKEIVAAEIERLKQLATNDYILTREARLALLTEIALNADENTTKKDRLRAVDILNKMTADYTENINAVVDGSIELTRSDAVNAALARLLNE